MDPARLAQTDRLWRAEMQLPSDRMQCCSTVSVPSVRVNLERVFAKPSRLVAQRSQRGEKSVGGPPKQQNGAQMLRAD
jgi:hypothetical protein